VTTQDSDSFSRREFLAFGASSVALLTHGLSKPLESPLVRNAGVSAARSLLLIHLSGGNDGYNTLVPYSEKDYYSLRPNLALHGDDLIKIDERFAFNSALSELAQLYREGVVAVFPMVGCDQSLTKSHFRASRFWETASLDEQWNSSWHERLHHASQSVSKIVIEGFDTHVDQRKQQFNSLRQLSIMLENLRPRLKNTLVFVYSEFGRSLVENSTLGTDHGSTGLSLALGEAVRGGIYPVDGELLPVAGNPKALDFRSLYESIASDWFKTSFNSKLSFNPVSQINFLNS
jgi:uncharacterized protein (DUF1501 family)